MPFRLAWYALVAAAALLQAAVAPAQPLETAVKAAFLPKFAPYIDWPPAMSAPGQPISLCIVGHDPFGKLADDAAAGQYVAGRPVVVRRMSMVDRSAPCHVAFVSGSSRQSVSEALSVLAGTPVLTVTDARNGPARGIIHFTLSGGRVRFYADDALAARGSLGISSRLLSLALDVRPRGRT